MKNITKIIIVSLVIAAAFGCNNDKYGGWDDGYSEPSFGGDKFTDYGENQFVAASEMPTSTFSVDTDGASYTIMRRYFNNDQKPPVASVRIEEYLNYFTFDYPEPHSGHNVSLQTEIASCPWTDGNYLLRIGLKGKDIPESQLPPTNYVFLIDVSGSMDSPDKLGILKEGFNSLVDVLGAQDRIAIVTYAGSSRVVLKSTSCDEKSKIKKAIGKLSAGGSTAGAQGILTAYEIAKENFIPGGNNRIIIGSDGDFNVGPSSNEALVGLIEGQRDYGIYLTVLGVGSGNLNDSMMEQLANKGNGTYEYIDNVDQMQKVFVNERSKFHAVAKDCKIQVNFNSAVVEKYRLIGYENRVMNNDDFDDDKKDAGEIGVGQTVTAIYEIVPTETFSGKAADIDIRYKLPSGAKNVMTLGGSAQAADTNIMSASENMRFAAGVTAFGLRMKNSEFKGKADKAMVLELCAEATGSDPFGYRQEFVRLAKKIGF